MWLVILSLHFPDEKEEEEKKIALEDWSDSSSHIVFFLIVFKYLARKRSARARENNMHTVFF